MKRILINHKFENFRQFIEGQDVPEEFNGLRKPGCFDRYNLPAPGNGDESQCIRYGDWWTPFQGAFIVLSDAQFRALTRRPLWERMGIDPTDNDEYPEWAEDISVSHVDCHFDFRDRLRILCTGTLYVTLKSFCEYPPGRMQSESMLRVPEVFGWIRKLRRRNQGCGTVEASSQKAGTE